jgi:hypothetical protein
LALVGAGLPGLVRQYRNRARFRGRLADEVEQLVREACIPLVHNAAVYGHRAGVAAGLAGAEAVSRSGRR